MVNAVSTLAVFVFVIIVIIVLGLSFYFARRTKSSSGYFAAGGQIHWGVNGIAFAGDYLSAASFLGICGMIATVGYDGFLYSIGYLAGWIVALFVVAEPLKRFGKYTFTDALDAKFDSRGIKLAGAISTLLVSICYLIPQMVGAGVLIEPLIGLPHWIGVVLVGAVVITIVATAGMTSTTYVQFLKGLMLIVFSTVIVIAVLGRGLSTKPDQGGKVPFHKYKTVPVSSFAPEELADVTVSKTVFTKATRGKDVTWWKKDGENLHEIQWEITKENGEKIVNGLPASKDNALRQVGNLQAIAGYEGDDAKTGAISPFKFLSILGNKKTEVIRWKIAKHMDGKDSVVLHYPVVTTGNLVLRPGLKYKVEGTTKDKLDFISLMLALFFGTSALPHILIRYYTVSSPAAARKSTILAIAAIGFFYILTLFMGLGAMTSNVINPLDNNMSAPLLARSFGELIFAIISAIAFATILGTVSGLIVAASGAVAHDLLDRYGKVKMSDNVKVMAGKLTAVVVGVIAIVLGILFKGINVSFLVGWAFAVAASANLPAIIMMLFWKRTTSAGITASIIVGIISSIGLFLISPSMYPLYGLPAADAPFPLENPGIVSIPLSFLFIVVVSLMTKERGNGKEAPQESAALAQ
jgi:cation/acetate symporter